MKEQKRTDQMARGKLNNPHQEETLMSDGELNIILETATVPPRPAKFWKRFPQRVLKSLSALPDSESKVNTNTVKAHRRVGKSGPSSK
jgi:hypothetical protein